MKLIYLKFAQLCLMLSLCLSAPTAWAVEIITHRNVTVAFLSQNQARSIFAMRQTVWPDGTEIKVFVLADQQPLHVELCKKVLGLYPYQLRTAWESLVFSGMGQAPVMVSSEKEMVARVALTPGAIGYVGNAGGIDALRVLAIH